MLKIFRNTNHLHFIGIGGIGMSGMAELLLNHGFVISGSDISNNGVPSGLQTLLLLEFSSRKYPTSILNYKNYLP